MSQIKHIDLAQLDMILQKIPNLPHEGLSGIADIAKALHLLDNDSTLTRDIINDVVQFIDDLKTVIFAFVDDCNRENLHRFPLSCYLSMTGDRVFAEEMTALYESGEKIPDCNDEDEYNEVDLFSRELNRLNNL